MPLRTCVVALNAYPAIDPEIPGSIGGIETRSWTLARGLAQLPNTDVEFVVRHSARLRQNRYDNVHLNLILDRHYHQRESLALRLTRRPSFPWVRWQSPSWRDPGTLGRILTQRLWHGRPDPMAPRPELERIEADLFLTFGVQGNSASVIASAHATHRPAVLFLGSDSDLDERYLSQQAYVSPYQDSAAVCRWVIENADHILCQTEAQQAKLARFGREATLIRNPIDLDVWDKQRHRPLPVELPKSLTRYALWIGRAESVHKQPLQLIEVARRCPEIPFLMILNRRDDQVEAEVRNSAPANVHILERITFEKMPSVMQHAAVMVNTSSLEGFPNTFLQAGACGVPVASLNVEFDFLRESRSGRYAAGNLETLATFVRDCWTGSPTGMDPAFARQFIEAQYALPAQSTALREALCAVLSDSRNQHEAP